MIWRRKAKRAAAQETPAAAVPTIGAETPAGQKNATTSPVSADPASAETSRTGVPAASRMTPEQALACGVNALAFLGDTVYEHAIREMLVAGGMVRADRLHYTAVRYVRAESQAEAMRALMKEGLTEAELALVKRARNHKTTNHSRSADVIDYKLATAFEALLGYLSLSGQQERLREMISRAVRLTDARSKEGNHEQS